MFNLMKFRLFWVLAFSLEAMASGAIFNPTYTYRTEAVLPYNIDTDSLTKPYDKPLFPPWVDVVVAADADQDGDGVVNLDDNCPSVANPFQQDSDWDGTGDACSDTDGDGVTNPDDNCPWVENEGQEDADGDGVGCLCDNCPVTKNPIEFATTAQLDIDEDGVGDVCDDDNDNDGAKDDQDNCPYKANADQADADGDKIGDVCDDDNRNGILDVEEAPPQCPQGRLLIDDQCQQPSPPPPPPPPSLETCPANFYLDGGQCLPNNVAPPPSDGGNQDNEIALPPETTPTPDVAPPADQEEDGVADTDEDGEPDISDNCPSSENPEQTDSDSIGGADGMGDACDPHPAFNDTLQAQVGGGCSLIIPESH